MRQVIMGGTDQPTSNVETRYHIISGGGNAWDADNEDGRSVITTPGTLSKMRVRLETAPSLTDTQTFTLMVNGVASVLTLIITGSETDGQDLTHNVVIAVGDTVSLEVNPAQGPNLTESWWSFRFDGDNDNESIITGAMKNTFANSVDFYLGVSGSSGPGSLTESEMQQLCATAGTIQDFYVNLDLDPGTAPDGYRLTVRLNGVSTTLTVTITADDLTGSDILNSFTVAPGDLLGIFVEPLNSPAIRPNGSWGMTFVADVDGESPLLGGAGGDNLHQTTTEYNYIHGATSLDWGTTERRRMFLGQQIVLKSLYVKLSAAPGSGNSYTFTTRLNESDGNVTATISDAATTGFDTSNTDAVSPNDDVSFKCVPSSTPNAAVVWWGFGLFSDPDMPDDGTAGPGPPGLTLNGPGGESSLREFNNLLIDIAQDILDPPGQTITLEPGQGSLKLTSESEGNMVIMTDDQS